MIKCNYIYHKPSKMDLCWKHSTYIHWNVRMSVPIYSPYYSALGCLLEFTTRFSLCLSRFTFYVFQTFCFTGYCTPHCFAQGNRINELVIIKLYVTFVLLVKGSCTWNRTEPKGGYGAVTETYYNNTKQILVELSLQCLFTIQNAKIHVDSCYQYISELDRLFVGMYK